MIVIELEEKKYGKTMEAVSKIRDYAECLAEMLEEHSMGHRYKPSKYEEDEYDERRGYGRKGGYGTRYM